jgi:2-aminoadipate transaminase
MVAALRREMPDASFEIPSGGYYIWLTLPEDVDSDRLARLAIDGGVTVLPGSKFFANPDVPHPRNHLRIAYSHATPDEVDDGIRRLAAAYRTLTAAGAPAVVS